MIHSEESVIWFTQNSHLIHKWNISTISFMYILSTIMYIWFTQENQSFDSLKSHLFLKWDIASFSLYILCTIMYIWFTQKRQSFDSLKRVIWFINGTLLLFLYVHFMYNYVHLIHSKESFDSQMDHCYYFLFTCQVELGQVSIFSVNNNLRFGLLFTQSYHMALDELHGPLKISLSDGDN